MIYCQQRFLLSNSKVRINSEVNEKTGKIGSVIWTLKGKSEEPQTWCAFVVWEARRSTVNSSDNPKVNEDTYPITVLNRERQRERIALPVVCPYLSLPVSET